MKIINKFIHSLLLDCGMSDKFVDNLSAIISLFILLLILFVVKWLVTKTLRATVIKFAEKTKTKWDDFFIHRKVFSAIAHLPTAIILSYTYNFSDIEWINSLLYIVSQLYYVVLITLVLTRVASVVNDMYQTTKYSKNRSIKGYIQLVQIFIYFIAIIIVISIFTGKNVTGILAGLSAIAAVLMLIFKDSILGFIASIQLSANSMLKPGDWIAMPSREADGTVIDISLNTVKVQNWDKTITTIPTYALVAESFNNWSGMEESGGRRIKRSILIDMTSVKFCSEELLEKLTTLHLLKEHVETKQKEIDQYNQSKNLVGNDGRRQTNIGVFRAYLEYYLKNNPHIHQGMTFLVRHLQPTEKGLPIEIYVFSNDQRWAYYEGIQADIFDHILAILPEFELRVFQSPTGHDFANFAKN